MFPFPSNPMQQQAPGMQMPAQQPQWQVPPMDASQAQSPMQSPWSQFQGGTQGAPQMMGQPGMPSMPSGAEQGDAMQRLLAEIRARQGQQQQAPAGNNVQSMLGVPPDTPQYARGGRPRKGRPAIVGEYGPEVFVPDQPGTILPTDHLLGLTRDAIGPKGEYERKMQYDLWNQDGLLHRFLLRDPE